MLGAITVQADRSEVPSGGGEPLVTLTSSSSHIVPITDRRGAIAESVISRTKTWSHLPTLQSAIHVLRISQASRSRQGQQIENWRESSK